MEIPLNAIHNYISAPVLLAFGIDNLRRYGKNQNTTSLQLALFCLLTSCAQFCFGLPALFTDNARLLSLGTLVGDFLLSFGLLFLWLTINRAFLASRPALRSMVTGLNWVVAIGICIYSVINNLWEPFSTSIVRDSLSGGVSLVYNDELAYSVLMGIHSLSLILIALYFWRQGKQAANAGQRLRIRSISIGMILGSSPYFVNPFLPIGAQANFSVIMWSSAALALASINIIGIFIGSNKQPISN